MSAIKVTLTSQGLVVRKPFGKEFDIFNSQALLNADYNLLGNIYIDKTIIISDASHAERKTVLIPTSRGYIFSPLHFQNIINFDNSILNYSQINEIRLIDLRGNVFYQLLNGGNSWHPQAILTSNQWNRFVNCFKTVFHDQIEQHPYYIACLSCVSAYAAWYCSGEIATVQSYKPINK